MKTVLIIAYFFPPDPEIGSLRLKGLAKYLPDFGWKPIVLTKNFQDQSDLNCEIVKTQFCEYNAINKFKGKIKLKPEEAVNKQLGIPELKNKFCWFDILQNKVAEIITYPDEYKDWYSHAFELGDKLLATRKIDAIISSSYPVTSHIVAHDLREKYCIPWVADLRDLWTQNHYHQYGQIRKFFEKRMEINTLLKSNIITTVSKDLASKLEIIHKGIPIFSIPNGFDLDEVNYNTSILTTKFTITYTGNLYRGKRDPSKLFEALNELILEKSINPRNIEVRFYCPHKFNWMKDEIEKYNLQGIVQDYEFLPRNIALLKQRESQLLILLLWDHPSEVGVYTGKVFEYLASKRPILAIGNLKGVVNELLKETNAGIFTSSIDEIKNSIMDFYRDYELNGEVTYKGDMSEIKKYSQKEMAKKFAEILDYL
jgi:hypothetical protein